MARHTRLLRTGISARDDGDAATDQRKIRMGSQKCSHLVWHEHASVLATRTRRQSVHSPPPTPYCAVRGQPTHEHDHPVLCRSGFPQYFLRLPKRSPRFCRIAQEIDGQEARRNCWAARFDIVLKLLDDKGNSLCPDRTPHAAKHILQRFLFGQLAID